MFAIVMMVIASIQEPFRMMKLKKEWVKRSEVPTDAEAACFYSLLLVGHDPEDKNDFYSERVRRLWAEKGPFDFSTPLQRAMTDNLVPYPGGDEEEELAMNEEYIEDQLRELGLGEKD